MPHLMFNSYYHSCNWCKYPNFGWLSEVFSPLMDKHCRGSKYSLEFQVSWKSCVMCLWFRLWCAAALTWCSSWETSSQHWESSTRSTCRTRTSPRAHKTDSSPIQTSISMRPDWSNHKWAALSGNSTRMHRDPITQKIPSRYIKWR